MMIFCAAASLTPQLTLSKGYLEAGSPPAAAAAGTGCSCAPQPRPQHLALQQTAETEACSLDASLPRCASLPQPA